KNTSRAVSICNLVFREVGKAARNFFAENPPLVTTSARNPPPFTFVHAYAGASESSGALCRVAGRERPVFWPFRRRTALSAFSRCAEGMLW
ncbi:hypothetical protein EPI62_25020, partial [Salmonella enterica]|nr:hypothetical protein [Salmonella enterica]